MLFAAANKGWVVWVGVDGTASCDTSTENFADFATAMECGVYFKKVHSTILEGVFLFLVIYPFSYSSPVRACSTVLEAAGRRAEVRVMAGTYLLSSQIEVPSHVNVVGGWVPTISYGWAHSTGGLGTCPWLRCPCLLALACALNWNTNQPNFRFINPLKLLYIFFG